MDLGEFDQKTSGKGAGLDGDPKVPRLCLEYPVFFGYFDASHFRILLKQTVYTLRSFFLRISEFETRNLLDRDGDVYTVVGNFARSPKLLPSTSFFLEAHISRES